VTAVQLADWRNRMGWTQAEAAAALNTPLGTYRGWEQGRHPAPGMIDVVCRELEQSTNT
jgi:DNA-binding transcriptional regulator YiaG